MTATIQRSSGALAAAAVGILLVLAQDVDPAWPGFHEWPYAAVLALLAVFVIGAFRSAVPGIAAALLGALVIVAAGIGSGLLGPDSETVIRAPGTVAPLPDAGAAAFFPNVGAVDVGRGDARVVVRRKDGTAFDLGLGERRYLGATELSLEPRLAAYLEAYTPAGQHLTITQPTNAAFLSPIVLFGQRVTIAGAVLPADSFATPGMRRQIKVFYFAKDAEGARAHGISGVPSLLFAVDDESGRLEPGGIGFVRDGGSALVGGLRLGGTIGTYPALVISAVPFAPALLVGMALLIGGLAFGWYEGHLAENARSQSDPDHTLRKTYP